MNHLHLHQRKDLLPIALPYFVYIDGRSMGVMRRSAKIALPNGNYQVGVWLVFLFFKWKLMLGADTQVSVLLGDVSIEFWHSEPVWDTIFNIDLIIWIASFFIEIPSPWSWLYHILSDGFFIVWIVRLIKNRSKYLNFKIVAQ